MTLKPDSIPQSVIDDDLQHSMSYFQALPYAQHLDGEASEWLEEICTNLAICVKARDFAPGVVTWVKRLTTYHKEMKHAIPRQTRARLAKLLYELTVMPGLETAIVEVCANACKKLLRKKRLGPEDLTLPWRPLYELILKFLFPKSRENIIYTESKHITAAIRLAESAHSYFGENAAAEILEEFLPKFSMHDVCDVLTPQGFLVLLLPTSIPRHSQTNIPLYANAIHPKDYLPTIFDMWASVTTSSVYDSQFVSLVSRIASSNISDPYTAEVGLFTKQQIKSIFTVLLRTLNLPVGGGAGGGGSGNGGSRTGFGTNASRTDIKGGNALLLRYKHDKFASFAHFIVYTIIPDDGTKDSSSSFTMDLLADFVQAIELYCHPSNHGPWSHSLAYLTQHLANEFLLRWREETEDECICHTPMERRLTSGLRKRFVMILRPLAYLSMFGKDSLVVGTTQVTLKLLCWLEPSLMFPGLLERIYPSLETLTETHRTTSALLHLSGLALPLLSRDHYPAGGKHLLPLLHLATPGIDMNDPIKTLWACVFIVTAVMTVPIRDLTSSTAKVVYEPTVDSEFRYGERMDVDPVDGEEEGKAELPREEEDRLCKATTGEFEEWVAKFLRRVFTIFENLPQLPRTPQKKVSIMNDDTSLTQILLHTCEVFFAQLSDELYDLALKMVLDFTNEQVLPNAVRAAGLLCDSVAAANPKKAAKHFIPLCIEKIKTELEHGASSTMTNSASSTPIQSDSTLHWYQNILFHVVSMMGPELLNYKTEIMDILSEMISKCKTRRGYMWSGKLLRNCLKTLLDVYPKESRSVPLDEWNNEDMMNNSHLRWGCTGDPKNVKIDWHVPTDEEKAFALELLETFLVPSMERIDTFTSGDMAGITDKHEQTNELCRHLAVIRNALLGSASMINDDGNDEAASSDESEQMKPYSQTRSRRSLHVGYAFGDESDPRQRSRARELRKKIGELTHQAIRYFQEHREDDLESIKVIIKIARTYLDNYGSEKSCLDRQKVLYDYSRISCCLPHSHKLYPRTILVRRAYTLHLRRLRFNVQGRTMTKMHQNIFEDLLSLSLSPYEDIRKLSQNTLSATIKNFVSARSLIVPKILDALQPNPDVDPSVYSHHLEGALHLLRHRSLLLPCLRDWRFTPKFVLSICRAQHEDRPTIHDLIRRVYADYITIFHQRSFRVLIPKDLDNILQGLYKEDDVQSEVAFLCGKVQERLENEWTAYDEMMKELLSLAQDPKLHWRFATMAANLLELFLRPEYPPTAELASFASQCLLSELPAMRGIGVGMTTQLLLYIKQRTFAQGDEDALIARTTRNPLRRELDINNVDRRQLLLDVPLATEAQATKDCILIDDPSTGWYVWPRKCKCYVPRTADLELPEIDKASQAAYEEFGKAYTSKDFWEKLLSYMTQEVTRAHEDVFSFVNAKFYASIFQAFEDAPVPTMRDYLVKLCEAADQKNHQRAAAELASGLIRGTKHWPLFKTAALWDWLSPLLAKTLANITPDSLTYWETFVKSCAVKRDPRRILPLIKIILDAEFDPASDAAFAEARKLILTRALITSIGWRAQRLAEKELLPIYMRNLAHPYKQVREAIGSNINMIMQLRWTAPSKPSVEDLLHSSGGVEITWTSSDDDLSDLLKCVGGGSSMESKKVYTNTSKTVLCWLHDALTSWRVAGTLPYVDAFWMHIFAMQECREDEDLQQMADPILGLVAQFSYPPEMVARMLDQFVEVLTKTESWHVRTRALPLLQVFFFKNIFSLDQEHIMRIMEMVSDMLLDNRIEVRQMAAVTLGGLVRCSQREAIENVKRRYSRLLLETRIPKRTRDPVTGKVVESKAFREALLKKHAAVLGLSCLVSAFPYEVPKWMPDILCQLANCMSDPAEIQATIRKTFSDFRRTHSDTWHEDITKFTEDQLSLLSDMLISPSYYA